MIQGTPNGIVMDPIIGIDLQPGPFYLDGHQLPGRHTPPGISHRDSGALVRGFEIAFPDR